MLQLWRAPNPGDIPPRINEFLQSLPGPVALHLPGEDSGRTRVLVTLSHGNEPSGLEALHQWLLSGRVPRTNVVVILGAVAAAQAEPLFYFRQLPGQRDLNRCFTPPHDDAQGQLAGEILRHIRAQRPEAVVDMHNTSGSSAAFAVIIGDSPGQRALAANFVDLTIVTDLRLGSLMEQDCGCPVVTVEAGGSQDEQAAVVARQGVFNYFTKADLFAAPNAVTILRHPLRLELSQHSRIDYAQRPLRDRDITVRDDIQRFNFIRVTPGEMLAWLGEDGLPHLLIGSDRQPHAVAEFFKVENGMLYPRRPMRLFMATTRPDIAASDCLFYFVVEGDDDGKGVGESAGNAAAGVFENAGGDVDAAVKGEG